MKKSEKKGEKKLTLCFFNIKIYFSLLLGYDYSHIMRTQYLDHIVLYSIVRITVFYQS
jgi:hypothetical protein